MFSPKYLFPAVIIVLVVAFVSGVQAALVTPTGVTTNARAGGPYTIGYEFTVGSNPITIDALGVEDDNSSGSGYGDGLIDTHAVCIWNSGGTLLYSTTAYAGTSAPLANGFRYAMLSSAITLSANTQYYIGTCFTNGGGHDTFYDGSSTAYFNATAGSVSFSGNNSSYNSGATTLLAPLCPTSAGGAAAGRWAGANANMFTLWTGANSNVWDAATSNWTNGSATTYSDGTIIGFNDSAGTNTTVNLSVANVSPAAVLFGNSARNYTLQGSYGVSGTTGLTMTGTGMVTISNTNAFTGTTAISAGTVQLGNANALVNSTVSVAAANGLAFATGTTAATLGGLSGGSSFALKDGGNNPVVLSVGNNGASTAYSGVMSGAGGLTKTGSGALTLSNANAFTGATTVSGGTLNVSGSIYTTASTQTINVAGGAMLQVSNAGNNSLGWGLGQTWNVAGAVNLTAGGAQILPGTLNLNGGTLTSTQTNATYGSFVVYNYNQLITASGSGNAITSL